MKSFWLICFFFNFSVNGSEISLKVLNDLNSKGYYYATLPIIKELLISKNSFGDKEDVRVVDNIVKKVGLKHFEPFPVQYLLRSKAPSFYYLAAKKNFNIGKSKEALINLKKIPSRHYLYPYAQFLRSIIFTLEKKKQKAVESYKKCIVSSNYLLKRTKNRYERIRLKKNRDSCSLGTARILFEKKNYLKSSTAYLDLPKKSVQWPMILIEEAWSAYYQKNYNLSLGKLASYNSPLLRFVFNPDIEVLRALSYSKLCLWGDVKRTVDSFYNRYEKSSEKMRSILRKKKNLLFYYQILKSKYAKNLRLDPLISRLLTGYIKQPVVREMLENIEEIELELKEANKESLPSLIRLLEFNLSEVMNLQRKLIGHSVKAYLLQTYLDIYRAIQKMSYIKLDVLDKQKAQLYKGPSVGKRRRGNIKYLKRSEKQYFWTFDNEFWADELGDYVFALGSEC